MDVRKQHHLNVVLLSLLCLQLLVGLLPADDWPQYLGPQRDGVWREDNVNLDIQTTSPKLIWSTPINSGYSGPSIANDRVFVMDRKSEVFDTKVVPGANLNFARAVIEGRERVLCLNASNGEIIWSHGYEITYTSTFPYAIGPRTTPLVDGQLLYTLGAEGDLRCLEVRTGDVVWKKNFFDDFNFDVPDWGTAAHPIVHEDLLICVAGGDGTTVVAYDKSSGKLKWSALSAENPGYNTPVIHTINGTEQLLVWHGESVNSLNPDTGELFWSIPFKPAYGMSVGAPVVADDLVYVMGYNGKSTAIRVSHDGRSAERVWGPHPKLGVAGVFNTALVLDGHVYSSGRRNMFRCVELETGNRIWEDPRPLMKADGSGKGPWASAFTVHHEPSGNTLIFNDHGEMIVSKLSPDGYKELGRMELIEPTHTVAGRLLVWSHPAFAYGNIYLRNDREVKCFSMEL